jgi:sterol desaturase/sphingolipid hydroxylase (fatty acid hydroxylase superfamily)
MEQLIGPQLQGFLIDVLRLSLWLVILAAIFVPLERLFAAHPQKVFRKQIVTDLGYYFLSSFSSAVLLSFPVALLASLVRHVVPDDFLRLMSVQPIFTKAVIGLVAGEVGYYWGHRLSHEIPFLWKFHSIHHSAEQIDFLVNTRAHPIDLVFGRFCGLIPIYLLGLGGPGGAKESLVPVIVTLIGTVWGFFIHANLRWRFGPLEWLISTPAFHHWHHTKTPVNRNYSSTLPWLDRIFGTYYLPQREFPATYGIKAKMPDSLVDQLFYPLERPPAVAETIEAAKSPEIADNSRSDEGFVNCQTVEAQTADHVKRHERDAAFIGETTSVLKEPDSRS